LATNSHLNSLPFCPSATVDTYDNSEKKKSCQAATLSPSALNFLSVESSVLPLAHFPPFSNVRLISSHDFEPFVLQSSRHQPTFPPTRHHKFSLFRSPSPLSQNRFYQLFLLKIDLFSPYPHRHAIIDRIVLQAINQNPHRHGIDRSLFRSPSPFSHGSAQTFGPFARGFWLDIFGSGLVWNWWK
jgi:hypothetical protein